MTTVEKNADFIKKQRTRIVKLVNEINTIVIIQNLNKDDVRWSIDFENSMNGNYISIRISDNNSKNCETVEKSDYWSLASILDTSRSFYSFNQSDFQKRVTIALKEIRKMKNLAQKYADLNYS